MFFFFFFSSRRRHTRFDCDWSSDVCSSDLLLERARDEVLDEDVGVLDQTREQSLAARVGEIERDRALPARVDLPPQFAALLEPGAQRIAAPRILDLDDVRAVVGEDGREHAAGDQPGAVDDAEAGERPPHRRGPPLQYRPRGPHTPPRTSVPLPAPPRAA